MSQSTKIVRLLLVIDIHHRFRRLTAAAVISVSLLGIDVPPIGRAQDPKSGLKRDLKIYDLSPAGLKLVFQYTGNSVSL